MPQIPQRVSARERLLQAASKLFYDRGVTATGIDTVIREAGVAKMSLYNNFASKDDLVTAYLEARHLEWLELHRARVDSATTAVDRVLAVFDAYADHASLEYANGFRGCGLLNAAAEFPTDSPARLVVRKHKEHVERLLEQASAEAGLTDPAGHAEHLSYLLEGAMGRAGLEGRADRLRAARRIAESIIGVT